jgi:hypothetical protein
MNDEKKSGKFDSLQHLLFDCDICNDFRLRQSSAFKAGKFFVFVIGLCAFAIFYEFLSRRN